MSGHLINDLPCIKPRPKLQVCLPFCLVGTGIPITKLPLLLKSNTRLYRLNCLRKIYNLASSIFQKNPFVQCESITRDTLNVPLCANRHGCVGKGLCLRFITSCDCHCDTCTFSKVAHRCMISLVSPDTISHRSKGMQSSTRCARFSALAARCGWFFVFDK